GSDLWVQPGWDEATVSDLLALVHSGGPPRTLQAADILRRDEWYHLALVMGPAGRKLFVNGTLMGSDVYTGLPALNNDDFNYIGRDVNSSKPEMAGQLAEFRVWNTQRTSDRIRDYMFRNLTGTEPGLIGLWNFADPTN